MDNLFDILIGLVIIYSILSPFLSKKKGKTPPTSQQGKGPQQTQTNKPRPELSNPNAPRNRTEPQSPNDILSEIESLFGGALKTERAETPKPAPPKPKPKPSVKPQPAQRQSGDYWNDKKKDPREYRYQEQVDAIRTVQNVLTHKTANYTYQELPKVQSIKHETPHKRETANPLVTKLYDEITMHPASVKDFFVVSELLAKPLSLRRGRQLV